MSIFILLPQVVLEFSCRLKFTKKGVVFKFPLRTCSLPFLAGFLAFRQWFLQIKKPSGVSRGLVMVQIGRLLLLEKFKPFLFFTFKLFNALLRSREIFRHSAA